MKILPRVLFLIVLICVSGLLEYSIYEDVKEKTILDLNAQQMILAKQAAVGITNFFNLYHHDLTYLSSGYSIVSMNRSGRREMHTYYELNASEIKAITRVSATGRILYTVPFNPEVINADISSQDHVRQILQTHEPVVSDVFTAVQGYQAVAYHVPVFMGREFRGSLAILIPFDHLARKYLQNISVGKHGYAWLISQKGIELYCPVPGHVGRSIFDTAEGFPALIDMAKEMMKRRQGSTIYEYNHVRNLKTRLTKKYAVYHPILLGQTFWSIAVATPEDEILAAIKGFRNKLIVIIALLMVVGLIYMSYLVKAWAIIQEQAKRRQAEEGAKTAQALLQESINQTPAGILIADAPDVNIRLANATALDIRGPSEDPLIDVSFQRHAENWQIYYPHGMIFNPRDLPLSRAVLEGKVSKDVEVIIRRNSGELRWVSANAAPVRNTGGDIIAGVMVFMDITERKQVESEKERLEAQLRQSQKMEAIGTLASGIAHDFNNILQAISGYVQLMSAIDGLNPRAQNYAAEIDTASHRARDLVQRLLTFSRKVEPELKSLDLREEIEHAVRMLERTIPKMILIEIQLPDDLKPINADANQINQVLMNLGANARDAMPDGGRLVFSVQNVLIDSSEHPAREGLAPGEYVLLKVSDTGHGMDRETLRHIFDPFFTTKKIGQGTGLGLSTIYGIVKGHGGYITGDSVLGQGSVFHIYFPSAGLEAEPEATAGIAEPTDIRGGNETILLVDDDNAVVEVARETLFQYGYKVITASSGEEALIVYREKTNPIDLVVMDLGMPGMGGQVCLKEILRIDPKMKVVIASGYAVTELANAALHAGAKGYINKPYRLKEMLIKIREVLDGASCPSSTVVKK